MKEFLNVAYRVLTSTILLFGALISHTQARAYSDLRYAKHILDNADFADIPMDPMSFFVWTGFGWVIPSILAAAASYVLLKPSASP